jgi:hypothetical protein
MSTPNKRGILQTPQKTTAPASGAGRKPTQNTVTAGKQSRRFPDKAIPDKANIRNG